MGKIRSPEKIVVIHLKTRLRKQENKHQTDCLDELWLAIEWKKKSKERIEDIRLRVRKAI